MREPAACFGDTAEFDDDLLARVDRWVRETPTAVAVVDRGVAYSFGELASATGAMRACLTRLGVDAELVATCLPRSAALVATAVGGAQAGGVYLPLGLANPAERVVALLRGSGTRVVGALPGSPGPAPLS